MEQPAECELCVRESVMAENQFAYVRPESNSLSRGHVIVVPKRHVADFFEMTPEEQAAVLDLLRKARERIRAEHAPDGFNIGVNVGQAAGQSRMHVHVHLIPRYVGDVPNPKGGIRCVLALHSPQLPPSVLKRGPSMKKAGASKSQSPSELISERIAELGDWRGKTLARMRKLIKDAVPDIVEEWKWMGTPVWSHDGIICTGESYKKVVKLTFAKGASLKDPARLFNSSLDGNVRRAIDIHEDEEVDASAFKTLVREAAALNSSVKTKTTKKPTKRAKPRA